VDYLYLNTITFPVRRGTLFRGWEELGDYCWEIEIHCGESPQLDYRNWPDDRAEEPLDILAGAEPSLYAQMLPLRVGSPHELVGRVYSFLQTPDDEAPDWPTGLGWPFFVLNLWEDCLAYPMRVAFTQQRGRQYRVEINGRYFDSGVSYDLRVQAWLDWCASAAEYNATAERPRDGGHSGFTLPPA
jgi:hypothetical protein